MWQYTILGFTYAFAAVLQPGPLQAYLLSQSIKKGFRRTLPAAFAPILSDGPIIVLVLLLLSTVPDWLINFLQILGGLFLLYLAYNSYMNKGSFDVNIEEQNRLEKQTLFKAVLVNLLNPNPYIGWSLIMGPLLIKGWQERPLIGITLIISFYVTIILGLIATIFLFSSFRKIGPKMNKIMTIISVAALTYFAIYELWGGIKYFLH